VLAAVKKKKRRKKGPTWAEKERKRGEIEGWFWDLELFLNHTSTKNHARNMNATLDSHFI
jgi:hypothetical protein